MHKIEVRMATGLELQAGKFARTQRLGRCDKDWTVAPLKLQK